MTLLSSLAFRPRQLAVWCGLWLAAGLFAGAAWAQGGGASSAVTGSVPAESPTLRKIRDTGLITLGYRTNSPPFSFLDARRVPVGYSLDLCERVVDAVKRRLALPDLEVRTVPVGSATRMPLVANGSVDLECGITTNTAERQKLVAFSVTTFVAGSKLLSRRSSGIRTVDDLQGRTVVSTLATTSIQYLHALNQARDLDMRILAGQDDVEAFRMVSTGRAVAYAMDDVLLLSLLSTAPDAADFVIADEPLTREPYGIPMRRGDPVFKKLVDDVLTDLYRRGEIMQIYRRWFQSPVGPRGVNLQLPMSESLQRAIRYPTDSPDPATYR